MLKHRAHKERQFSVSSRKLYAESGVHGLFLLIIDFDLSLRIFTCCRASTTKMPPSNNIHTNSVQRRTTTASRIDENSASNNGSKPIACCLVKSCPAGNLPFSDLTTATTFIDFSACTILILPCTASAKAVREARAVAELRTILQQEATLLDKRGLSVWRLRLDALTVIGKMVSNLTKSALIIKIKSAECLAESIVTL